MVRSLEGRASFHRRRLRGALPEPVVLRWPDDAPDGDPDADWLAGLTQAIWRSQRPAWTDGSWWEAIMRDEVRALLWLPAGPELAAALAALPRSPICPLPHVEDRMLSLPTPGQALGWPCACQVVVAAAWESCAAWVAANSARALVEAAGRVPVHIDVAGGTHQLHDPARDELAPALRWTVSSAGNRIAAARDLVARRHLLDMVESAAMSAWAARLVCDHLIDLTADQATAVVGDVAVRVRRRLASGRRAYNSAEINRIARAARLRICPEAEQEARVRAWVRRRVVVHRNADGMATLIADLAETDAHRIHRRLTAIAAGLQADAGSVGPAGGQTDAGSIGPAGVQTDTGLDGPANGQPDARTRDQMRADILVDLLLGTPTAARDGSSPAGAEPLATPSPATRPPRHTDTDPRADTDPVGPRRAGSVGCRPDVQVIVTLETLLGLAQDPALVPGLGPIPAEVARGLAADGRWTAWLTDATGTVTATGTRSYSPSAAVARLVRAREPHCRFPGCRQPAARCDLDHTIPWPRGSTTPENLGPLCRRHHQLKTHGGWTIRNLGDIEPGGAPPGWRWTTPAGLTVTDTPEPPLS